MSYLDALKAKCNTGPFTAPIYSQCVSRKVQYELGEQVHLDITYADLEGDEIVEALLYEPGKLHILDEDDLQLLREADILPAQEA